ncbi:hypothetical protein CC85DRAFT_42082 [Cutaneotrichosporon oleaginosum]|uniref:Xylanolytic transcriptional activator regulatory domain-containing protein n=1 Tax=Cutaneotrichosporon oleaginosum TaxID=879819 RepID=A0A0J0XRH7_9TREE|nr:uncharacterized protein CC85DRAFT_42082 [Cutaneotrichosporon oleaginosum]KLT43693.1 hypothetical protein CC85DRAFT_42082 [Cutaneotrichosporon oleaginosum]TXT05112.1 hypothetical protein COLE_06432 [Cutaneotrichosporon oleaginosum]
MVANALRFAAEPTQNNLERSDNIVNGIVAKLVPRVLEGFGVVHLMTLLLTCYCEGQRGRVGSRWLLAAMTVRMMQLMSLQTVDEHAAAVSDLSPLLTHEALRRVAWSVFFLDSTLDGGRLGSGLVDVSLFHIQLPCTEESFMGNDNPRTGSIFESPSEDEGATLGISAHLMRAVLLRRRAFDILLRLRHRNFDALRTESDLVALELSLTEVTTSLPPRYRFSEDTAYLYRQRMPAFLLFHLLLLKVSIVINTTRLALLQKSGATASADIAPLRLERIKHAISISRIVAEGLKHPAPWDMQASAHAYIALEILLFEPRRLTELHDTEQVLSKDVSTSIAPLLVALREGSARSEIVRLLVRRLILHLLTPAYRGRPQVTALRPAVPSEWSRP